ncbi:ParM/StbA family protein [Intestinibacter sp.]
MAIVGLDFGNITTIAISKDKEMIVESRILEATDINKLGKEDIFKFEGVEYVVNAGHFENNSLKYKKDNFLSLLYYSIAKVTNSNSIDLVTGIPAGQYDLNRKEMTELIKTNNTKTITIDNLERNITINNILVVPEGYSLKTFNEIMQKCERGLKTIVVDLGGGTTDIAQFNEEFNFTGGDSIKYGLLDLYRQARKVINNTYQLNVTLEEAKKYFDGELNLINKDKDYKIEIMRNCIRTIVNELRGLYPNLSNLNIILAGGGASKIYPTFEKLYPQAILVDDIKANAIGYYKIGAVKYE